MVRHGLPNPAIHVRAVRESSPPEKRRFSQADGGIRMYNGAFVSVLVAARLRTNTTC